MSVSREARELARGIAVGFGGKPRVERFWDDSRESRVDILTCVDRPVQGVTSYSTLGLSSVPLLKDGLELDVRAELVGACASGFDEFANCLATAAFNVVNNGWLVAPGSIFPDILRMYRSGAGMSDLMFVPPFLWEALPTSLRSSGQTIGLLLAVPISSDEREYAEEHGVDALEDVFQQAQIDVFNLERPSVFA